VPCKPTATEKYLSAEAKVKEALNNLIFDKDGNLDVE
jgi:hypothetical protein